MKTTHRSWIAWLMGVFMLGLLALPAYPAQALPNVDIVFVARAHLATKDDIFQDELGPAGQFGSGLPKFAPGSKLMIRKADGTLITLVDGSNPVTSPGNLIDVQSPDVSFDGTKIIFAGATTVDPQSSQYGWRLYEINADGSNFHKINVVDRSFNDVPNNNPNQYNFGNDETYNWWNDLFPAYLADGRIVFASTRYPSRSNYDARHTYNLYVMNGDGSNLRRITTERGGLLHPTPLPDGRILVARWWNNFNQPSDKGIFNRIDNQPTDHTLPDGTLIYANPDAEFDPSKGRLPSGFEIRGGPNTWHLMSLRPDGTDFHRFAFTAYSKYELTNDSGLDTYVGAQPAVIISGGQTYIAFTSQQDTTMVHSTLKSGIRLARPGVEMMYANTADAIAGLTYDKVWGHDDESPPYAIHPWGMPDGTILFSYVITTTGGLPAAGNYVDPVTGHTFARQGSSYQYQLYTMNVDGSSKTAIPMSIGTADAMDAKPLVARAGWSALSDTFTATPNDDPRQWNVPNTLAEYSFSQKGPGQIQTATIHNPNVYANAPLDLPYINNSPIPGSVALAQVYLDANQFTGAYCYGNYPNPCATFKPDVELRAVLWTQVPVGLAGEFTAQVPADVPGFIVLRDANGKVVSGWNRGYISIAQGNAWARPGETVTCTGCHLGHVSGSVAAVQAEAEQGWTNVAPYASVQASSYNEPNDQYQPFAPWRVNDRRGWVPVPSGGLGGPFQDDTTGWISLTNQAVGAWVELTWPSAVLIKKIRWLARLPLPGIGVAFCKAQFSWAVSYHCLSTLRFYKDGVEVGSAVNTGQIEPLSAGGTAINLPSPLEVDQIKFTVNSISGKWHHQDVAALNELEIIGMAAVPFQSPIKYTYLPVVLK
ncbi:MAG: hypothetical protein U0401_28035 [Anaerolineae bacterium]